MKLLISEESFYRSNHDQTIFHFKICQVDKVLKLMTVYDLFGA